VDDGSRCGPGRARLRPPGGRAATEAREPPPGDANGWREGGQAQTPRHAWPVSRSVAQNQFQDTDVEGHHERRQKDKDGEEHHDYGVRPGVRDEYGADHTDCGGRCQVPVTRFHRVSRLAIGVRGQLPGRSAETLPPGPSRQNASAKATGGLSSPRDRVPRKRGRRRRTRLGAAPVAYARRELPPVNQRVWAAFDDSLDG
jgi:hypothetical protein